MNFLLEETLLLISKEKERLERMNVAVLEQFLN